MYKREARPTEQSCEVFVTCRGVRRASSKCIRRERDDYRPARTNAGTPADGPRRHNRARNYGLDWMSREGWCHVEPRTRNFNRNVRGPFNDERPRLLNWTRQSGRTGNRRRDYNVTRRSVTGSWRSSA